MDVGIPAPRRIVAGLLSLAVSALLVPLGAAAGTTSSSVDLGDQAVINLMVRGRGNEVTVRVWDRPTVQVDYAEDAAPMIERRQVTFGLGRLALAQQIPPMLFVVRDANGGPAPPGALPPEEFPFASFRAGAHDVVRVNAPEGSHLVVTIPASTGILSLRTGGSQTNIEGYRGANLVVIQSQGRVQVTGATTTAFVQMTTGSFYAAESTFDRIRVRGVMAHDVFERCRTKQIEVTSVAGSMVYDGGTFDPGLARFESQGGNIALGVTSAAQLNGRSGEGRVYTLFERRAASVEQRGEGEATATVGGGGPLVNAISARGNVYLYDGTLTSRRTPGAEWRAVHQLFNTHRRPAGRRL